MADAPARPAADTEGVVVRTRLMYASALFACLIVIAITAYEGAISGDVHRTALLAEAAVAAIAAVAYYRYVRRTSL
jgi:hypothetical protein